MIRNCGCTKEHEFQDEKYGKGVRVITESSSTDPNYGTCTVCGTTKSFSPTPLHKGATPHANIA